MMDADRNAPLQNRVTPFGDIVAIDPRGLFTGNRASAEAFRDAWTKAHRLDVPPSAPAMDAILHSEQFRHRCKHIHPLTVPLADLPGGTTVVHNGVAFVIVSGQAHQRSEGGHDLAPHLSRADGLLHHLRRYVQCARAIDPSYTQQLILVGN